MSCACSYFDVPHVAENVVLEASKIGDVLCAHRMGS